MVDIDDFLVVVGNWGYSCSTGQFTNVGSLRSVEDCMDAASQYYTEHSEAWNNFVNKCVAGLCAQHIIDCN